VDHLAISLADTPNHAYWSTMRRSVRMAANVVIGQPPLPVAPHLPPPLLALVSSGLAVDVSVISMWPHRENRVLEFDAPLTNNKAASRVLGQAAA